MSVNDSRSTDRALSFGKSLLILIHSLLSAMVQSNSLRSGGLGIPELIGSNTEYGLSGDWASTRVNGPRVGGLSDRWPPLGGVL